LERLNVNTLERSYTVDDAIARISAAPRPASARRIAEEIMNVLADSSIDAIYRDRVLSSRSRQYKLPAGRPDSPIEIIHTLLGIELKIGNRRLLCPDYATARYLSIFARLGGGTVAVPYDITSISAIADEMESSLQRTWLLADLLTRDRTSTMLGRVRKVLVSQVREKIAEQGSGARFPEFLPPRRGRRRTPAD